VSAAVELPLEEPGCALCGGLDAAPAIAHPSFDPYRIVRCCACGLAYLSPRPTEAAMRALYERDDYYEAEGASGYASYREQEAALRLTFRRLLRSLARRGLIGGSLLEVGCGHGYLLDEAAAWFDRREGTEYSAAAAQAAARRADRIYRGGIEAVSPDARYDLVVSNQVIEHVHQPRAFLAAQVTRLRPGGAVLVATPWMGSPWQRVLGRRWPSFKVPEHVFYFDRRSLSALMRSAGLDRIREVPYPHAFPLSLVAAKLGLQVGGRAGRLSIWIPATTLALVGVRRGTTL
jgi:SAM-dependent methyltransferase